MCVCVVQAWKLEQERLKEEDQVSRSKKEEKGKGPAKGAERADSSKDKKKTPPVAKKSREDVSKTPDAPAAPPPADQAGELQAAEDAFAVRGWLHTHTHTCMQAYTHTHTVWRRCVFVTFLCMCETGETDKNDLGGFIQTRVCVCVCVCVHVGLHRVQHGGEPYPGVWPGAVPVRSEERRVGEEE